MSAIVGDDQIEYDEDPKYDGDYVDPDPDDKELTQGPGLTGPQTSFMAQLLTVNASWSASIHNAALDGQERASNEWAARYLNVVTLLRHICNTTSKYETETVIFERLCNLSDEQSFWPRHADEQIEQYHARLQKEREADAARKAEREGVPA